MGITKHLMLEEMELEQALQEAEENGDTKNIKRLRRELKEYDKLSQAWQAQLRRIAHD